MPISLSAKKSLRKSRKNRKDNLIWKNKYKEILVKFVEKSNKDTLAELYSIIDKLLQRGIFHKNKVKRLKSKFSKKIKSAVVADAGAKKVVKKEVKKVVKKEVKKVAKKKVKKVVK